MISSTITGFAGQNLTAQLLNTKKEDFKTRIEQLGKDTKEAYTRREVKVSYRGVELPIVVNSVMDEYSVAEQAFISGGRYVASLMVR